LPEEEDEFEERIELVEEIEHIQEFIVDF